MSKPTYRELATNFDLWCKFVVLEEQVSECEFNEMSIDEKLASISNTMDIGDVTTLANPEIVEQIRVMVQARRRSQPRPVPKTSRVSAKNDHCGVTNLAQIELRRDW
jgi:hypothetical protein